MLKEAMQYLIGLKRPEVVETNDRIYSTVGMEQLDREENVEPIKVRSLSGLVDYIKSNFDHDRELMVHIESPTKVVVFDALNKDNDRRFYLQSNAMLPQIQLERHIGREEFNIMMQACFVTEDTDKETVLRVISSIVEEESVTQNDDGVSQRVTAKTGIATRGVEDVPNPVTLKPFRTFVEVPQPPSKFVLRIKEGGRVGLFEADGGAWELNAMANIEIYLKQNLEELIDDGTVIIVA